MPTYDEIENAIIKRVIDAWTPTGYLWTIENDELDTNDNPWIRIAVTYGADQILAIGSSMRKRRQGVCIVQIFTKPNTAVKETNRLKQVVIDAFENVNLRDNVKYSGVVPARVGVANGWFQENVTAIFRWETRV